MTLLSIKFYEHDQDVYGIIIINSELHVSISRKHRTNLS